MRNLRPRLHPELAIAIAALALGGSLTVGCLKPPGPGQESASAKPGGKGGSTVSAVDGYLKSTWGDSSGGDGKGGVKLTVNADKRLPLVAADFDPKKRGDAVTEKKRDWLLFHGPGGQSLAFEFTWVTTESDKFFGNTWAGGGLAFNDSWAAVNGEGARYLVLWVRTDHPGVELAVNLQGVSKSKGKDATGQVSLVDYVPGGRLDEQWRRAVIPMSEFLDVDLVNLQGLQQVIFNLKGGYPENEAVRVLIDNVYLTDIEMVTPVMNAGYLVEDDGVLLRWEQTPGEKVKHYQVSVDGKATLEVPADARSVLVPRGKLPAKGTAKVAIATVGANETTDPIELTVSPTAAPTAKATVKLAAPTHEVSPHIFGINFGTATMAKDIGATGRRWGGNRTTKYNWKDDADSAGVDWFYLNDPPNPGAPKPEAEKQYHRFIKETLAAGVEVNFCIPISDWVAKLHPEKDQRYCSFPVSLFPAQQKTDGQGCGIGLDPQGKKLWNDDPGRTMVANTVEFQRGFVTTVVKEFGTAAAGGVEFYSLDNEPGLWAHTHRDTMPMGVSAERLGQLNLDYAAMIKGIDPTAKVIGFGAWGVLELAGSNEDYMPPGRDGYKREEKLADKDQYRERKRHGDKSQLVYLLERFREAEKTRGKRLIDVIDIHWYPEIYGVDSKGQKHRVMDDLAYDPVFAKIQWEALREWYDPTFTVGGKIESWTHDANAKYLWDPHHPVLPALKGLFEKHYPGTKLAINEYDVGSPEKYHGALLRAALYGIFMQEDLFMAQNWHQTDHKKFTYFAQKLYGNYDGKGGRVKGKFVPTTSSDADLLSYAARSGAVTTVVLVNKDPKGQKAVTLEVAAGAKRVRTFLLAESMGLRLFESAVKPAGKSVEVHLPPYTAMLVELG